MRDVSERRPKRHGAICPDSLFEIARQSILAFAKFGVCVCVRARVCVCVRVCVGLAGSLWGWMKREPKGKQVPFGLPVPHVHLVGCVSLG